MYKPYRFIISTCWAIACYLLVQPSSAADKALLDVLLANKVIGQNQYDTLIHNDQTETSGDLLEVLKQNGAISEGQYQGLIKANPVPALNTPTTEITAATINTDQNNKTVSSEIFHAHGGINAGGAPEPNRVGKEVLPGTHATFGGFIESADVYRSKNETQDINSNFNTAIPFANSANAHQGEFRASARQSRLSLLLEGYYDEQTKLASYLEMDFLGVSNANSVQTNSYSPRLRLAYATIDWQDSGWHVLAGQSWSLLTTHKSGINPRSENPPLMIDGGFIPGFNYTRSPQLRLVKDLLNRKLWLALSLESPQVNFAGITPQGNAVNQASGGALSPGINYSTDIAPDIISKIAVDPGWGHYELFGITRFFHNATNNGSQIANHVVESLAGGGGALLPLVDKLLDVQFDFMAGSGIGRYSSAQLPDLAFANSGAMVPLTQYTGLLGIIAHPDPDWDLYSYVGGELISRYNQTLPGFGYGDTSLITAGCNTFGGTCNAQTANVWQVTPGFWTTVFRGNAGTVKTGLQYSYTRRNAFSGVGNIAPHTDDNMLFFSFRYYPLQK